MFLKDAQLKRIKQIKNGQGTIKPCFHVLAEHVASAYNVNVIDVFHQSYPNEGLFFILNTENETQDFFDEYGLNKTIQNDIREAAEKINDPELQKILSIKGLYFSFDDFETSEKRYVVNCESVQKSVKELAKKADVKCRFIADLEDYLCLYPTDLDLNENKDNGVNKFIELEIKKIIQKYDEYNVINYTHPLVKFDSEQNYNKYHPREYYDRLGWIRKDNC